MIPPFCPVRACSLHALTGQNEWRGVSRLVGSERPQSGSQLAAERGGALHLEVLVAAHRAGEAHELGRSSEALGRRIGRHHDRAGSNGWALPAGTAAAAMPIQNIPALVGITITSQAAAFTGKNERNPFVDPKLVKEIYEASIR